LHRDKFVKIAIPILAVLLLNSVYIAFSASSIAVNNPGIQALPITPYDFPRLDTLYCVEAWPWDTALTMAKECKIDEFKGAIQTSAINDLRALDWTVTNSGGGLHYCYLGFNCRDYVPSSGGSPFYDYHGRLPGFALFPVNESSFRHALPYIYGCNKTAWIWNIYQYINIRVDFPMPTGFTEWRNPYITEYPLDWALAEDILLENGFTVNKGGHPTDRTYWIWYCPLRPGDVTPMKLIGGRNSASPGSDRPSGDGFGIYVMSPGPAPTSVQITDLHCKAFNEFFTGESTGCKAGDPAWTYCLFHHDVAATTAYMINTVWCSRAHDIFMLCGSFGANNPDFLFDTYHSSQDMYDGNDDSGIVNAGLDNLLWTIKTFQMKDYEILAYNLGTYPTGLVLPASTHYTVAQPAYVLDVKIERCDKTGVYYVILVPGVDYTLIGTDLHLLKPITLYPGDALEINYDTGTYVRLVTNVDFFRDVVWLADWKIFYLAPQIAIYGRDYFDLFKPGHIGWVQMTGSPVIGMPGVGAGAYMLPWTYCNIHETGSATGGAYKYQNDGDVVSLNPIKVKWVYEVEIMDRIFEGLITRDPYTLMEMNWLVWNTTWERSWTAPGGVPGEIMRFYLRNDVTWQDGTPVTAQSIKWNFDYINSTCPDIGARMPEYVTIWSFYQGCTIINPYTIDVYVNMTGHWKVLDYESVALQFPQVIWENKLTYADRTNFKPWAIPYATLVGHAPPNGLAGLSCLIGTGPFFLNMTAGGWDELGLCVLSKYPGYWKRLANAGDVNLDMVVNEDDLWFFCAQFINYYKLNYANVFCDFDRNMNIDEDDLWYFCARFIDYYKYGLHGP